MTQRGSNFENDRKWCPECEAYVPFLLSVSESYCVECGGQVRLFSRDDWESFADKMSARRGPKHRRGKKRQDKGRRDSA